MFLWSLLKTSPMSAVALLLTLATLFWCLRLVRRQPTRMDRYLMALLGLIAMYQGLSILKNAGFWALPETMHNISGAVDLIVAALYFVSTLFLQFASAERHNTRIQLRVVEADQPSQRPATQVPHIPERTALAVFGIDVSGTINLWHSSAEDFFGWQRDEALGTRLPFRGNDRLTSGPPNLLRLRTRHDDLDALVWVMPVPGETGSLVLVLDARRSYQQESARNHTAPSLSRPELSTI